MRSTSPSNFRVKALYDYTGDSADDLCFKAGDILQLSHKISDDWLVGWNTSDDIGRMGLVPCNFIDRTPPGLPKESSSPASPVEDSPVFAESDMTINRSLNQQQSHVQQGNGNQGSLVGQTVTAVYEYISEDTRDLNFEAGDQIRITRVVNDDWLEGVLTIGLTSTRAMPPGLFPAAYVDMASVFAEESNGDADTIHDDGNATVLYDFDARTEDELSVSAGQSINAVNHENSEWVIVVLSDGRSGCVPSSFVQFR